MQMAAASGSSSLRRRCLLLLPLLDVAPLSAATLSRGAVSAPDGKRYPVRRVVELLQDMKNQLEKEQDEDEAVYEKLACWCETNDKGKTQAIADAEKKLSQLAAEAETLSARSASLGVEIESLEKEVAKNQKSLATATALRERQAAEFTAEEKEMVQSIRALDSAVTVLSKHHGSAAAAFLDDRSSKGAAVAAETSAAAKVAMKALNRFGASVLRGALAPSQRRVLEALAQQAAAPYTPQSGQIFGILRQMKETFENNLSGSQREELEAQRAYDELKAAKEEEIATGQASLQDKREHLAATDDSLAQARDERKDTEVALGADQAFLLDLKSRCSLTDKEWQTRQQTRRGELSAVAEAISILSNDDARDLASRTFNAASFLQTASRSSDVEVANARRRASDALRTAAATDPRIGLLTQRVKLDAFTQVKQAIDNMVAELLREAADEEKHRDYCIDELAKNERATANEVHNKAKVESDIEGLETHLKGLSATIATLESEIEDLKSQRQRAQEDRDLAHKDFQGTVVDQRETQKMLQKAMDVLKGVYATEPAGAELLQQRRQAPPPGFKEYEKSQKRADGVLGLLSHILEEAKALETEAVEAEEQARDAHAKLQQEIADSIAAKEQSIVDRSSDKAQAEQDLTTKKGELRTSTGELEALASTKAGLHGNCDFFLKNTDARTQAREEEIEALRQAKAYLSGMQ